MQVSRTAPPSRSGISVNDAGPETRNRTAPRERSRIEFPYLDLANALDVAMSIRSMPKAPCTLEALATKFKQQKRGRNIPFADVFCGKLWPNREPPKDSI